MSETRCGDHEGEASPSKGASTQDTPQSAPEPEMIEVTLGTDPDTLPECLMREVRASIRYVRFRYDRFTAQYLPGHRVYLSLIHI